MQFNAELTGDAAALARSHNDLLARLPGTLSAFILVELQKWSLLFPPEQRYQRTLLEHLSRIPRGELEQSAAGISRVEAEAGVNKIGERNPVRFQDEAQSLLRRRGLFVAWRGEVDGFFQTIDPALEKQLYPADAPRRLIVQIYGREIAAERDRMWARFKRTGLRVPLNLEGAADTNAFLAALFGASTDPDALPALLNAAWIIEAHQALHALCDGDARLITSAEATAVKKSSRYEGLTGLSYDRLRPYRNDLTRTLNAKIQSGVESPQAFAAYTRSLKLPAPAGTLLRSDDVLLAFLRDVLLSGNGTMIVNNTFVEWAAAQALRRAQPRMLVTRFGVRDKLKPFSSMIMFSQARPTDHQPVVQDPAGSFIDVEQLSYYVWVNAEKNPAYRGKTLYLFLAEGVDEMLAIGPATGTAPPTAMAAARLEDVCATMARWLDVPIPAGSGRPISVLL
jgi:hypothetical protein